MGNVPQQSNLRQILTTFGGFGFEMAAAVFLGAILGYYLDNLLGTSPFLLILGIILGSAAGFLNFYRIFTKNK